MTALLAIQLQYQSTVQQKQDQTTKYRELADLATGIQFSLLASNIHMCQPKRDKKWDIWQGEVTSVYITVRAVTTHLDPVYQGRVHGVTTLGSIIFSKCVCV